MVLRRLEDPNTDPDALRVFHEIELSRRLRQRADDERAHRHMDETLEVENLRAAEKEGAIGECGCCFSNCPLNRMVHCNSEKDIHWFCRNCARLTAETEIGNGKFELICMSMDGCSAGFDLEQRKQYLDEKSVVALERNELEASLRLAGIENLANCPFCPWAAEYPSISENKVFVCQNQACARESCRLCNLDAHLPQTCEENAKNNGLNIRRQIEEAMSMALIRKCNKCETPFIKEEGCNKMTCTKCRNVQCYVCSESCSYQHFDDSRRGGKVGNCPLFDDVGVRHYEEGR